MRWCHKQGGIIILLFWHFFSPMHCVAFGDIGWVHAAVQDLGGHLLVSLLYSEHHKSKTQSSKRRNFHLQLHKHNRMMNVVSTEID